jgi:lipopolysaccharide transport system ATP-binding protein
MPPAIRVDSLSKLYRLGVTHSGSVRELVNSAVGRIFGRLPARHAALPGSRSDAEGQFWALRDVSFEIEPGEVVGIIGKNGAGKSTLLKILSRITQPTVGRVELRGQVASLLEVGTGFHPELTGRENVYMNGAILGMSRREIARKLDQIVAFAEVEEFLDTPVKRYSSGMYVRLAFAVAAHLRPEILVVDEVLAVGDAAFQRKCLSKMSEVSQTGRTVIFVSHNMVAVRSLCERSVWLSEGELLQIGPTSAIIDQYMAGGFDIIHERRWDSSLLADSDSVRMVRVNLLSDREEITESIGLGSPLEVACELLIPQSADDFHLAVHLHDDQGCYVLASASPKFRGRGGPMRIECAIPPHLLNDGRYRVMVTIARNGTIPVLTLADVLVFEVVEEHRDVDWFGDWPGCVRPSLQWTLSDVTSSSPAAQPL